MPEPLFYPDIRWIWKQNQNIPVRFRSSISSSLRTEQNYLSLWFQALDAMFDVLFYFFHTEKYADFRSYSTRKYMNKLRPTFDTYLFPIFVYGQDTDAHSRSDL